MFPQLLHSFPALGIVFQGAIGLSQEAKVPFPRRMGAIEDELRTVV